MTPRRRMVAVQRFVEGRGAETAVTEFDEFPEILLEDAQGEAPFSICWLN